VYVRVCNVSTCVCARERARIREGTHVQYPVAYIDALIELNNLRVLRATTCVCVCACCGCALSVYVCMRLCLYVCVMYAYLISTQWTSEVQAPNSRR